MAGFSLQIEVDNLGPARKALDRYREAGVNLEPLLDVVGAVLEASTIRRFDTESGPGGVPWIKSKPALGLAPRASGKRTPGKTLTDTSDLRDSIRRETRPNEVEIGADGLTNPVKAIANQLGSHRQAVVVAHTRTINSAFGVPLPEPREQKVRAHGMITNLPARPFVGVDDDDRRNAGEAMLDYLAKEFQ